MKVLISLGLLIIAVVIFYFFGLISIYNAGSGFIVREPGGKLENKTCKGLNIVLYDQRPMDGGAAFLCIGLLSTEIKTITY